MSAPDFTFSIPNSQAPAWTDRFNQPQAGTGTMCPETMHTHARRATTQRWHCRAGAELRLVQLGIQIFCGERIQVTFLALSHQQDAQVSQFFLPQYRNAPHGLVRGADKARDFCFKKTDGIVQDSPQNFAVSMCSLESKRFNGANCPYRRLKWRDLRCGIWSLSHRVRGPFAAGVVCSLHVQVRINKFATSTCQE